MPQDERAIKAALLASKRAWAEFPYYENRYGQRGKRFSDSDTCWLVTLTALDQASLQGQVDWLCRVLATRGMPSIMMETTLRYLYEELEKEISGESAAHEKLLAAAETLKEARESYIPEEAFKAMAQKFDDALDTGQAKAWKNTGSLVVSVVVDEKNGIDGAVSAMADWLTDDSQFDDLWIKRTQEAFREAVKEIKLQLEYDLIPAR